MSDFTTAGPTLTNASTWPTPKHQHPRSSWRYLESKEEYPWAGSFYVVRQYVSYFLCEECGQVLRIVARDEP